MTKSSAYKFNISAHSNGKEIMKKQNLCIHNILVIEY